MKYGHLGHIRETVPIPYKSVLIIPGLTNLSQVFEYLKKNCNDRIGKEFIIELRFIEPLDVDDVSIPYWN